MDPATPEYHDLVLVLSRIVDHARDTIAADEPDWRPLRRVMPLTHCDGFMWMGSEFTGDGVRVEVYKHGITRRHLRLDQCGRAYRSGEHGVLSVAIEHALAHVFDGLDEMGWSRETPYDDEFIATRNARLAQLGITTIS